MSNYAKLVLVLPEPPLPIGTRVKNVRPHDDGYAFDAEVGGVWIRLSTLEELPMYTDKGRAHRAKSRYPVMEPEPPREQGRPPVNSMATIGHALAVRLTAKQREWVSAKAERVKLSPSAYVRHLLLKAGMPR